MIPRTQIIADEKALDIYLNALENPRASISAVRIYLEMVGEFKKANQLYPLKLIPYNPLVAFGDGNPEMLTNRVLAAILEIDCISSWFK